jgi:sulfur dioxygenase
MAIQVSELNNTNCKTYLLWAGADAALVDPVREHLETYRAAIASRGLALRMVLETHTHADHLMLPRASKDLLAARFIMHRESPSPLVDQHVDDGDVLVLSSERIRVLHTPGHTRDSICFVIPGAVLTGDTLLIGGSGRADFPGSDAAAQYDSVVGKLFALPDETHVLPGHDYRGNTRSTIGDEKRNNPRFAGTREQYVGIMGALGLPFPEKIQQALQVNQSGFEADEVSFPTVSAVASVTQLAARDVAARLGGEQPSVVLDVREPEEFVGDLGHIQGALLIPLDSLERRLPKLAGYVDREVVVVCRAGARSASAGAILSRAGWRHVSNLEGGMIEWVAAGLPVQR